MPEAKKTTRRQPAKNPTKTTKAAKTPGTGKAPERTTQATPPPPPAAPAQPPRFAITGTGRSGTGYLAALMEANGITCGHEGWWRPDGIGRHTGGLTGDASWLALPAIETGAWSGPVALVVRHPVNTVRSLVGTKLFEPGDHDTHLTTAYRRFAHTHCPQTASLDPLQAAVEFWSDWNTRCAAVADVKLRIEDLNQPWALAELGDALGVHLDPTACARVPTDTNHRERAAVPATRIWQLLDGRAAHFGYHP
ncbi:hypothetical protein [Streptomyces synnematoformans]|uniref:Sulfotransferase family protein n=1 Tax=Streptomyces synnematoformans TaxID=415721 RepID=A0ABN2XD92_9ACTN